MNDSDLRHAEQVLPSLLPATIANPTLLRLSIAAAEKKHQNCFYPPPDSIPPTLPITQDPALSAHSPSDVSLDAIIPSSTHQLSLLTAKLGFVNASRTFIKPFTSFLLSVLIPSNALQARPAANGKVPFLANSSCSLVLKTGDNSKLDICHDLHCGSYTHNFSVSNPTYSLQLSRVRPNCARVDLSQHGNLYLLR